MTRLLAIFFALFATVAYAQKGTPTFQIDRSGTTRCLYAWDLNNTTATDKGLPFGCIDGKGAWNLPAALRNAKDIDETTLRGFGYIGDGNTHPLSSITSLNGRSTIGWTLSQWQSVLPAAGALSDEIDGAVINSVIQATTGQVRFRLGPGTARFSRPITSACGQSVSFAGAGTESTKLQFGATNGWNHCASGTTQPDKLELKDIALQSTDTASTSTVGINARFVPSVNIFFDNIKVYNFNQGMLLVNAAGSTINKAVVESGRAVGTATLGNGIEFQGTTSHVNHVSNSLVQHYMVGYRFLSTNTLPVLGMEDQSLINTAAGEVKQCVEITATDGGYSPLQYVIDNFSCNAYSGFVNAQAAAHLTIRGGNWIIEAAAGGWSGAGQDFFRFCRVITGRLEGAWITNNTLAASINSYIHLIANGTTCGSPSGVGASNIQIINNKIEYLNVTAAAALIVKDNLAGAIFVKDNTFTSGFNPQPSPPANAFSWTSFDINSALFPGIPGETVQLNGGSVGMSNVTAANVGTLSVPPGRWSCHARLLFVPSGSTVTVFQGAFNTTSATIPAAPGNGMFSIAGSWTGNVVEGIGPYIFDFTTATANTSLYVVGIAAFSGGTLNMSTVAQCVRLR